MEEVQIQFHLKCKKKKKKKKWLKWALSISISAFWFLRANGQLYIRKPIILWFFVCQQCQTENFLDFNKVFNYRILKMVNDLYLIQHWQQKEQ